MGSEHPEVSRTEPISPGVQRGTIRTPNSKVGKKGMCKKGDGQKGRQVMTSSTSGGLHNKSPSNVFGVLQSTRDIY